MNTTKATGKLPDGLAEKIANEVGCHINTVKGVKKKLDNRILLRTDHQRRIADKIIEGLRRSYQLQTEYDKIQQKAS